MLTLTARAQDPDGVVLTLGPEALVSVEAGEAELARTGDPHVPAGGVVARGHDVLLRASPSALPSALPPVLVSALRTPGGHLVVLALDVHDVHVLADAEALLADLLEGLHVAVVRVGVRDVEPLRPEVFGARFGLRRLLRGAGGLDDLRGYGCRGGRGRARAG